MLESFDQMWMTISYVIAMKSKDSSTTVGSVVVGPDNEVRSMGYNNFVRGWDDDDPRNHERPYKYEITEHSERNAMYNATLAGVSFKGCVMYATWYPCCDCARGIVQTGITEIVIHADSPYNLSQGWSESQETAAEILKQGGVTVREWNGVIPEITGLLNGETVYPTKFGVEK